MTRSPGERYRLASPCARERLHTLVILLLSLTVFLALAPHFIRRLDPVTGDEPFYLMTATSLIQDLDIDEANNYANRDFDRFYPPNPLPADWQGWPSFPDPLPPHPTAAHRAGLYSKHGLGLALLVALPYAGLGRVGAVLFMNVIAALLATNVWLLYRQWLSRWSASLLTALAVLTLPVLPYGFLIFPELPAALLITYVARRILAVRNDLWQVALAGSALAFLPWLHTRFLPIVLAGVGLLLLRHREQLRRRAWLAVLALPVALSAAVYLSLLTWLYGHPTIPVQDHAGFHGVIASLNAAAGLLLDAQWGLFVYAPVYLLGIVALVIGLVRRQPDAETVLLLVMPYVMLIAAYRVWWGEWGPPARYLVPVAPLLLVPLASWLGRAGRWGWSLVAPFALLGLAVMLTGVADPQRLYHHPDGYSKIYGAMADWSGLNIDKWLVAFQPYSTSPATERVIWMTITAVLMLSVAIIATAISHHARRGTRESRCVPRNTVYEAPKP